MAGKSWLFTLEVLGIDSGNGNASHGSRPVRPACSKQRTLVAALHGPARLAQLHPNPPADAYH